MAAADKSFSDQQTTFTMQDRLATDCGNHEIEWCYNSTTLWNNQLKCAKNPGHFNFIPVREFGNGHLPIECRDKRIVSYIKKVSNFTVRLLVKHTSDDRPVYYPSANLRRSDLIRLASGYAWLPGNTTAYPCPISDCPYSRKSHNVYGYIRILTNKHVVFDLAEAMKTQVQFFYDSHHHSDRIFIAQCIGFEYSLEDNDTAHLQCVTHDPDLCHLLKKYLDEATVLYTSIPPDVWQSCRDLCVVIGHPHGMPKVISIGKHVHFEVTMSRSHAHYHTGPTCFGSSGCPVYYVSQKEKGNHSMWIPAIHSFHCLTSKMNCAFR